MGYAPDGDGSGVAVPTIGRTVGNAPDGDGSGVAVPTDGWRVGDVPDGDGSGVAVPTIGRTVGTAPDGDGSGVSVPTAGRTVGTAPVGDGSGVFVPTIGWTVGAAGGMLPIGTDIGESTGTEAGTVVPGSEFGKAVGVGVGTGTGALGASMGVAVSPCGEILVLGPGIGWRAGAEDGVFGLGTDTGDTVCADGELFTGRAVGASVPDSDGINVSSMNGERLEGDGEIDNKIGAIDGRILTTGEFTGTLLGKAGTVVPGARTESSIWTIPLQPSIFVAKTVALSNLTGSIETVTESPASKVSSSPATIFSTKCNPGSI